jgi:predicted RND superfamily exporter protein
LFYYYKFIDQGLSSKDAIEKCMVMEGSPVIATSIILCVGFAILGLASIKSIVYFGILIALTMFFALVSDIVMLPAIVTRDYRK